jgi:hypothetical protein
LAPQTFAEVDDRSESADTVALRTAFCRSVGCARIAGRRELSRQKNIRQSVYATTGDPDGAAQAAPHKEGRGWPDWLISNRRTGDQKRDYVAENAADVFSNRHKSGE